MARCFEVSVPAGPSRWGRWPVSPHGEYLWAFDFGPLRLLRRKHG